MTTTPIIDTSLKYYVVFRSKDTVPADQLIADTVIHIDPSRSIEGLLSDIQRKFLQILPLKSVAPSQLRITAEIFADSKIRALPILTHNFYLKEFPSVTGRRNYKTKQVYDFSNITNDMSVETATALKAASDNLKHFESGAVRSKDADHARYDLIPQAAIEAMAITLKKGEERYGKDNWKKGIPAEDLMNHCLQHIYKWLDGDRSEEHIAHAMCNLAFLAYFESIKPTPGRA